MLIEFAVTNFRSIKERQSISMLPSERVKPENRKNTLFPIKQYKDLELLTVAAIFGGNGAGKSNLIKAFKAMKWLVLQSHRFTRGDTLHANEYFAFDNYHAQPTIFEITFIGNDKKQYLYKIEFDKNAIKKEELHYFVVSATGKITKRKLYVRVGKDDMSFGDDFKGTKKINLIAEILFLSKSIHEGDEFLTSVFDFFKNGFRISDFSNEQNDFQLRYFGNATLSENKEKLAILNEALHNIDSGILSVDVKKVAHLPENIRIKDIDESDEDAQAAREKLLNILKTEIYTTHRLFENEKEIGSHSLKLQQESEGTQKFIAIFLALQELLQEGSLIIIDEMERSLHPLLTDALLKMLLNPLNNPNGAQVIFSTHTPYILDRLDFDQVNLVQKDEFGATEVYRISDIRNVRPDTLLSRAYLHGVFEGIPTISNLYVSPRNLVEHE